MRPAAAFRIGCASALAAVSIACGGGGGDVYDAAGRAPQRPPWMFADRSCAFDSADDVPAGAYLVCWHFVVGRAADGWPVHTWPSTRTISALPAPAAETRPGAAEHCAKYAPDPCWLDIRGGRVVASGWMPVEVRNKPY